MWEKKIHSTFIDNIWGADLEDIQLINKFIEGLKLLLCYFFILDTFSKYAWVIPLKHYNY